MSGLHHLALRTRDVERLARHYENACGLARRERRDNGNVWLAADAVVLMIEPLAKGEPSVMPGSLDLLAFALPAGDTLEAACARLDALGLEVEARTDATLYFRDPDGRRNGLSVYRFGA